MRSWLVPGGDEISPVGTQHVTTHVAGVGWGAGLEKMVQAEEPASVQMVSPGVATQSAGVEQRGRGAEGEDVGPAVATPCRGLSLCSGVSVLL